MIRINPLSGSVDAPPIGFGSGLVKECVLDLTHTAGFADAGLLALPYANEVRDAERFRQWIDFGHAASMNYLQRTAENGELLRVRVQNPFPWARSVLVCFAPYAASGPLSTDAAPAQNGWIARYAWSSRKDPGGQRRPSDYHKILLKKLRAIEQQLHAQFGTFESRAFVDTGPVVERALAVAAGLGWTGKNACLIHPRLGSFGFLAVLITSLPVLEQTAPSAVPDHCGSCTRCLDACPTGALIAPGQMDASRCIAYLTIEHKGPITNDLAARMGRQVFGCDICQDICPWNAKARRDALLLVDPDLEPRAELVNPALEWLASLDEPAFERLFNGSPVRRAGFAGFRRNLAIAMGNSSIGRFAPQLESWLDAADEGLRTAARWALGKLCAPQFHKQTPAPEESNPAARS